MYIFILILGKIFDLVKMKIKILNKNIRIVLEKKEKWKVVILIKYIFIWG